MKKYLNYLKDNIALKIIFSFIFSLLTTLGGCVSGNRLHSNALVYILVFASKAVFIYVLLTLIYNLFDRIKVSKEIKGLPHVFLLSFLILFTFYSIEFMGLYPGIFSYDAPTQLEMYMTYSISEWHPVIHTFILGKFFEIGYSLGLDFAGCSAAYSIFQYSVIALCFSYVLKHVFFYTRSKVIWCISIVFLALFPTISLQVFSCTKDSFFMAFFALSMTLTLELFETPKEFFSNKKKMISWVVFTLLMIIFRNNCVYVAPVLLFIVIGLGKNKKASLCLTFAVILFFILYKLLFVNFVATYSSDDREKYPMLAQQLAHIYMDDNANLSDYDRQFLNNLFYIDFGFENYCESHADPVKVSIDINYLNDNKGLFWKCYFNSVIHNPKLAMEAFLKLTCGFWYPIYDLTIDWTGQKGYWEVGDFLRCNLYPKNMSIYRFFSWFDTSGFSEQRLISVYLLFAPATFFYIFLLFFSYAIKKSNKAYISAYLFTFCYWCTFLLGPVVVVRYTTYLYAILPLHFCLLRKQNG